MKFCLLFNNSIILKERRRNIMNKEAEDLINEIVLLILKNYL
mgnify:CR=1 FL=1